MKRLLPLATLVTVLTAATNTRAEERVYDFSMPSAVNSSGQSKTIFAPQKNNYTSARPYQNAPLFSPRARTGNEQAKDAALELMKDKVSFKVKEFNFFGKPLYELKLRPDYLKARGVVPDSDDEYVALVIKGHF